MRRFKNILVGVDLASGEQIVAENPSDATNAAIANGLWLAKQNDANIVFFAALEIPDYVRFAAEELGDVELSLIEEYEDRLSALVQSAKKEGIAASHVLVIGKSWIEIIRQVLKQQHDLVIVGTRQRSTLTSTLFGSTGMKLLRKCPCPVWICKPQKQECATSILVADDLTPVSDLALELGVSMAQLRAAELHVLHVLELGVGRQGWDTFEVRQRARAEATEMLSAQIAQVHADKLQRQARIEIVIDTADAGIMKEITKHDIGLLVMATVARGGITGILTGNTAERLLPQIPCSVLAVKPHDFVCPISIE